MTPEQQEFLRAKLSRPMVARLVEKAEGSILLPVRHRHSLGGCEGQLSVEEDRLIYLTDHSRDNRAWKLRDIETIGSPDPYHLRVTTYNETFTFDLKSPLDPKIYDSLWKRIYRLDKGEGVRGEKMKVHGNEPASRMTPAHQTTISGFGGHEAATNHTAISWQRPFFKLEPNKHPR